MKTKKIQYWHYCQFRVVCEKVERQSHLPNAINQCFTNLTSTTSTVLHQQMKYCLFYLTFKITPAAQTK